MNKPTAEEARAILAEINQIAAQTRNAIAASSLGPNLMVWGLVWMAGFVATYLAPARSGLIWAIVTSAGAIVSAALTIRAVRRRDVLSEADRRLGRQIGLFWLTIFGYASGFAVLFRPSDGRDYVVIFVLFSMMAYVLMGTWLRSGILVLIGLGVSAAAIGGRLGLDEATFMLWMAAFGGGGLFLPGLYIQLRWR